MGGVGKVVSGKWRQLYMNNNEKRKKIKKTMVIMIKDEL